MTGMTLFSRLALVCRPGMSATAEMNWSAEQLLSTMPFWPATSCR